MTLTGKKITLIKTLTEVRTVQFRSVCRVITALRFLIFNQLAYNLCQEGLKILG